MSLRADLERHIRSDGNQKVRRARNGGIEFRCPSHQPDNTPSAWMGDFAWKCLSCGAEGTLRQLAELVGMPVVAEGYTLDEYARSKNFDVGKLKEWGLETANVNGRDVLVIPYHGTDGRLLRNRYRGDDGRRWWEGRNRQIYPYGLDRLPRANSTNERGETCKVILVEGESDCHAAWHEGLTALGIPGATTWQSGWARSLQGMEVFVWQEPDDGGAAFVRSIAKDFPHARIMRSDKVKDLCELRQKSNGDLGTQVATLMASATPIGAREAPVSLVTLLGDELDRIADRKAQPVDATPTPYPTWNKVCRGAGGEAGIARGWHVVVGGKSSSGKSLTAANLANSAVKAGEVVTYLSLEMSTDETATRILASFARESIGSLNHGRGFDRHVWDRAKAELDKEHQHSGGVLHLNESPIRSLEDIVDCIHWSHEVLGSRFFLVDYMQLAWTGGSDKMFDRITEVSHQIRLAAKQLRVTTVGFSQLNRGASNSPERPAKESLSGGSPLENDADQVLLLDHSRLKRVENGDIHSFAVLDKNRHGETVMFPTVLERRTLRLREADKDEEKDVWGD